MNLDVLYAKPKKLKQKELRFAILLGCILIAPLFVLSLIKGFYKTNLTVDVSCLVLHIYGWFRLIQCENYRMYNQKIDADVKEVEGVERDESEAA